MKTKIKIIDSFFFKAAVLAGVFLSATNIFAESNTRVITDMYGRKLTVPAVINRVLPTGPVDTEMVYLLAPDKLVGLGMSFNGKPPFVADKYKKLQAVSKGGGGGKEPVNYESFMAAKPDIVLGATKSSIDERQDKLGDIPVVGIVYNTFETKTSEAADSIDDYGASIRFLGKLLNVEARAESLLVYYKNAKDYVVKVLSSIPAKDRVRVYYAEGKDGLNTDPAGSWHTKLLHVCGGINVAKVEVQTGFGMANTSLEQILLWDPDMIIIGRGSQENLFKRIMTDSRWAQLKAVQNKKVSVRPDNPFSWFDGPPGPCQFLGMYWMINKLYPAKTADLDLKSKVREFYSKFFHYNLSDAELGKLLSDPR